MRPHGSASELEKRRRRAVALLQEDYSVDQVARRVAATPQNVRRWRREYARGGEAALAAKPVPGGPRALAPRQERGLRQRLTRGALAQGFSTDLWTCPRVKALIERCYGVSYHVDHIPKLLHRLGFSPSEARTTGQKPRRRGNPAVAG